jgi:hypothetical protein
MFRRLLFSAVATGCMLAVCAGCSGTGSAGKAKVAAQGIAPDDAALHPNRNAPYFMPGETPHLIARATALEAQNAGPCDPDVLSVEEIAGDANGVFRSVKLAFMNRGAAPCKLGGYPSVALIGTEGENIGSIAMERVSGAQVVAELSKSPGPGAERAGAGGDADAARGRGVRSGLDHGRGVFAGGADSGDRSGNEADVYDCPAVEDLHGADSGDGAAAGRGRCVDRRSPILAFSVQRSAFTRGMRVCR